jgi:hypothetical protein
MFRFLGTILIWIKFFGTIFAGDFFISFWGTIFGRVLVCWELFLQSFLELFLPEICFYKYFGELFLPEF